MPTVDRTKFSPEPKHGGFTGLVQLSGRSAGVTVRSTTGNVEQAWVNAERVLTCLRDQMSSVEAAVRDLFSRLATPDEDTPKGRRKMERALGNMERMLVELGESDVTCLIYDDSASVFFNAPRMEGGHVIEVRFARGCKLILATIAG
jgi:hypothetical protein